MYEKQTEQQYKLALEADPNHASAHYNYANLLKEQGRREEAEQHFKEAIQANPKFAQAHTNYALLLQEKGCNDEAEQQYNLAIDADPKLAQAHYNYANLLKEQGRNKEAEQHYKLAIQANPKYAQACCNWSLLLVDYEKREEVIKKANFASKLFEKDGNKIMKHLSIAWMYEKYSEKYFVKHEFLKSSSDATKAANEYFKAIKYADFDIKDSFNYKGNFLKARAAVRNIPRLSKMEWLKKKMGRYPDISQMVINLQGASEWYEKAAICRFDEKKDECIACSNAIGVLSDVLNVLQELLEEKSPDINEKIWKSKMDNARSTYAELIKSDTSIKGEALIDVIEELIKCVIKIADYTKNGNIPVQMEKIGECYKTLKKISENLDGALKVISDHYTGIIGEYAKKEGYPGILEIRKETFFHKWSRKIIENPVISLIGLLITILGFIMLFL